MPTQPQTGAQIRAQAEKKANRADYRAILKRVEKALELLNEAVELTEDASVEVRQELKSHPSRPVGYVFDRALFLNNMVAEPEYIYHRPTRRKEADS